MKESDYIVISDRARVSATIAILRDSIAMSGDHEAAKLIKESVKILYEAEEILFDLIKLDNNPHKQP